MVNLLAFALAINALITPTMPQPVRNDYMIALLGHERHQNIARQPSQVTALDRDPWISGASADTHVLALRTLNSHVTDPR
ncbi:hypothetical protein ACVWZW_005875 [Bradyrhizobium sp. F1.13.4]|uniref:hypothetical protein n=1 Tax=Bradyrhizobium sp. F1.13.3 TaxID=3156351 RepID=UPI00339287EB